MTLSCNSLRQTVHTHRASVHQAAKLVAALLRVAGVNAGLAESNDSLQPGLWLTSPAGWLQRTGISSGTLRSVIEYGLPLPFTPKLSFCLCSDRGTLWRHFWSYCRVTKSLPSLFCYAAWSSSRKWKESLRTFFCTRGPPQPLDYYEILYSALEVTF